MHSWPFGLMQSVKAGPANVVATCVSKSTRDRVSLATPFITFHFTN